MNALIQLVINLSAMAFVVCLIRILSLVFTDLIEVRPTAEDEHMVKGVKDA